MYSLIRNKTYLSFFLAIAYFLSTGTFAAEGSLFSQGINQASPLAAAAPIVVTKNPIADAYVRDGSSYENQNFGKQTVLLVKAASTEQFRRQAYLKFALTGLTGNITSAKLRLYGGNDSSSGYSGKDDTYAVEDTGWSETAITWNNKPALDAKLSTATITSAKQYYEWDVTSFVQARQALGQSAVSFAVTMLNSPPNDKMDVFNSREASSNLPELVITVDANVATIGPSADAYVRDGSENANQNFGKATVLLVKEASTVRFRRIAYLKFDISPFTKIIAGAKLRLYGGNASSSGYSGYDDAFSVSDNAWTETGITWNNRPVLGSLLSSANITSKKQYYEWDVGSFVKSQQTAKQGAVSFAIEMRQSPSNDDYDVFNSKEASSNNPQLVITFE